MNERGWKQPDVEEQEIKEQEWKEIKILTEPILEKDKKRREKLRQQKGNEYLEEPLKERRECGPEIEVLEKLFAYFESNYSLDELNSIVKDDSKDVVNYNLRASARELLKPILIQLGILERETNITTEKHKELFKQYKICSNAAGSVNSGKIEHDRNVIED